MLNADKVLDLSPHCPGARYIYFRSGPAEDGRMSLPWVRYWSTLHVGDWSIVTSVWGSLKRDVCVYSVSKTVIRAGTIVS